MTSQLRRKPLITVLKAHHKTTDAAPAALSVNREVCQVVSWHKIRIAAIAVALTLSSLMVVASPVDAQTTVYRPSPKVAPAIYRSDRDSTRVAYASYNQTPSSTSNLEWLPPTPSRPTLSPAPVARSQAKTFVQPINSRSQHTDQLTAGRAPVSLMPVVQASFQQQEPSEMPAPVNPHAIDAAPIASVPEPTANNASAMRLAMQPESSLGRIGSPGNMSSLPSSIPGSPAMQGASPGVLDISPTPLMEDCMDSSKMSKIAQLGISIKPSDGMFPRECELTHSGSVDRFWNETDYHWQASNLSHNPAYFEDVQLARYGHSWGPILQPVVSGARFFATVPILPYKMGLQLPNECVYSLGYYRPGNCAPYMLDPLPLSIRAGLFQAGAVVGAVAVIP